MTTLSTDEKILKELASIRKLLVLLCLKKPNEAINQEKIAVAIGADQSAVSRMLKTKK